MASYLNLLRGLSLVAAAALLCAGCETATSMSKRIDYKSTGASPALEIPPDLTTPRYDDRFAANTATGVAAQAANRPKQADLLPTEPDARIARAGQERWLVVKATPEQAWNVTRQFWGEMGFVIASENPTIGVMETDWAENRADIPEDFIRRTIGKYFDLFYTTYKRDKFRTRIERGVDPGTVDIYVSHRGMEQVPTTKIDNSSPAAFAWALMPPDPNIEAEMLTRLMTKFGATELQATTAVQQAGAPATLRARVEKGADGVPKLVVDDSFDRAWRRVGLALDRSGFTVVDRDRSKGLYFVRYSNPDMSPSKGETGFLTRLANLFRKEEGERPEQYRVLVAEAASSSVVSVQDPGGAPDKSATGEKILALLQDQLK